MLETTEIPRSKTFRRKAGWWGKGISCPTNPSQWRCQMRMRKLIKIHQPKPVHSQLCRGSHRSLLHSFIATTILPMLLLAACSADQETPLPGDPGGQADDGGPADQATIGLAWQASPHANTYVLDDAGENNACARCHSPVNWVPTMDDMPESCTACKFEVQDPLPLIAELDWLSIPCIVCHERDGDTVNSGIAWLEIAQIESYAAVGSANELCLKCHSAESVPQHKFPPLGGAHADYQCVQCHDAHATTASCDDEACHADVVGPAVAIVGHDDDHQDVSCWACHDAGALDVAPDPELGYWTTMLSSMDESSSGDIPVVSHDLVREANCERCHYTDNPWNLSAEVSSP